MKRREFIAALGGAVTIATPITAHPQQAERVRRIGMLMNLAADDPQSVARMTAFVQGLQELGWTHGRNMRIEVRWAAGDADRMHKSAAELISLTPDIILASSGPTVQALLQVTRTVPIVFAQATDPVGVGFVESLARPGGNITGLTNLSGRLGGKRLELLKEAVPKVARVAILYDPATPANRGELKEVQTVAPELKLTVQPWELGDVDGFDKVFAGLNKERPDGLHVLGSPLLT